MPHDAEIREARQTISRLQKAQSSIRSALSGNRSLLNEAGYGSLVSRADSLTQRISGAIRSARSFISENEGGHPPGEGPGRPIPVPDPPNPNPPRPEPPTDPAPDPPRDPEPPERPGPPPVDPPGQPTPPGPIDPPRLPVPTPRPSPDPGDPSRRPQLLGTVEVRGSH